MISSKAKHIMAGINMGGGEKPDLNVPFKEFKTSETLSNYMLYYLFGKTREICSNLLPSHYIQLFKLMLFHSMSLKKALWLHIYSFCQTFWPKERLEDFYHVLAMEITSVHVVFDQWMHRVLAVTNRVTLTQFTQTGKGLQKTFTE